MASFSFFYFNGFTQEYSKVKYGKVSPDDFTINSSVVDNSTEAVVVSDIGSSEFVGNMKSSFSIVFTRSNRILIIDKKGIDAATVEIPLYVASSGEEKLLNLKARTYNLENGKIIEADLDKESVFKEKRNKNLLITKFTMPAVKPGSIIEYSYTIHSDFIFNLQSWESRENIPVCGANMKYGSRNISNTYSCRRDQRISPSQTERIRWENGRSLTS